MKVIAKSLCTAAIIGVAASLSPAWAAEEPPASSGTDGASTQEAEPASAEIVVNARRRAERIIDVPIAIVALGGPALAARGVSRVDDLQTSTPSFRSAPTLSKRSNTQYEIRGITTVESLITEDPAVGVYVDDVYRARATGTNQSFFDINNVQVLYGPQGTLFGRNSTAGAVLINSNHPTNHYEGSIEAGYGNLNASKVTAVLNVPLSDTFQVRLAGEHSHQDGYVTNASTGGKLGGYDSWAGRASLHFAPASSIDNLLIFGYYQADDQGTPSEIYRFRSSTTPNAYGQVPALAGTSLSPLVIAALAAQRAAGPYTAFLSAPGATIPVAGGAPIALTGRTGYGIQRTTLLNANPYEKPLNFSISNTTTINLSDTVVFKNIFGYNYVRLESSTDLDGTPLNLIDNYTYSTNRQISNETQISGRSGKLTWVVGGLYFRESGGDFSSSVQFLQLVTWNNLHGVNQSEGVFAQGTYKITDRLNFTAGGRYTWDQREADFSDVRIGSLGTALATNGGYGVNFVGTVNCALAASLQNNGPCALIEKKSFARPSYTLSLDYKPNENTLFYIAHRNGYRSGGFNSRLSPTASAIVQTAQAAPFEPETVKDVEIGFKGKFTVGKADGHASLALYNSWYSNVQKQVANVVNGAGVSLITNAGSATIKGAEFTAGITPFRGFEIDGYASYIDGQYKNFPNPDVRPGAKPLVPFLPLATAKWNVGATVTITPIDSDAGRVSLATTFSYRSAYYGDYSLPAIDEEARAPSQTNVNMSLRWDHILRTGFSASAWVRNLTNQTHYLGVLDLVPAFGLAIANIGEPRTYGFNLKYAFGS